MTKCVELDDTFVFLGVEAGWWHFEGPGLVWVGEYLSGSVDTPARRGLLRMPLSSAQKWPSISNRLSPPMCIILATPEVFFNRVFFFRLGHPPLWNLPTFCGRKVATPQTPGNPGSSPGRPREEEGRGVHRFQFPWGGGVRSGVPPPKVV